MSNGKSCLLCHKPLVVLPLSLIKNLNLLLLCLKTPKTDKALSGLVLAWVWQKFQPQPKVAGGVVEKAGVWGIPPNARLNQWL